MAFVSYTYTRYDLATKQYFYTIVDSDFGAVEVGVEVAAGDWAGVGIGAGVGSVIVAREYIKRGLPVGRNLALLILYIHKQYGNSIANTKRWQDKYCSKHIENWAMYAKERDEHLSKLSALL